MKTTKQPKQVSYHLNGKIVGRAQFYLHFEIRDRKKQAVKQQGDKK